MANLLFATFCCLLPALVIAIGVLIGAAQRVGEHGTYRYKQSKDDNNYLRNGMSWYTTEFYQPKDADK